MKQLLFKPFERFSENQLLIVGICATLIGSYLAYLFDGRYDGALDFHLIKSKNGYEPFIDNGINIFTTFVFVFIAAKIVNGKTRIIDAFTSVLVARIPLYLLPFTNFNLALSNDIDPTDLNAMMAYLNEHIVAVAIISILSILAVVWFIALLWNGYKTASNAKGTKAILLFISAILLAEITSKICIHYLN